MQSLRRVLSYMRPYTLAAVLAPLLMVLEVAMDLSQPRLMERIIDVGIANLDMQVVLSTSLIMVGFAVVGLIGGVGCTVAAVSVSLSAGADLRSAVFRRIQSFSFANLDGFGTGHLVTRLTNDITQIQEIIQIMLRVMVRSPLLVIGGIVMAVLTSPRLALLLLVLVPVLVGILAWGIRRSFPWFTKVQAALDQMNTIVQEDLAGMRLVKAFVRGEHEKRRFENGNEEFVSTNLRVAQLMAMVMPLIMLTMNAGVVAVVWFGGVQVVQHGLKVGQVMAFVNYLTQMMGSLLMVGMLLIRVSRGGASANRILEVLDSEPTVRDRPGALDAFEARGRVAFEHVTFGYEGNEHPVLQDINLVAEPGQVVAVLGTTGAGKSTLVHLIPRFYDVTAGRVTLDGQDVRDISTDALRRNVGIALQESVLFSGTVRDNIRYGRPEASEEEVVAAAKAAQAHEFISQLPDGYDTTLGQRGVNLSGGQKQRVAIARALLINPAVLILDDSTSAVDVETEGRIQTALAEFMRGSDLPAARTSFIIAQRISSVMKADKIVVLDNGAVAAEGTHQELMLSSPIYRQIYDLQLGTGAGETAGTAEGEGAANG
ncbi:MAG: ABC transporter ATP-binding protein [Anaerolineae bacterium]